MAQNGYVVFEQKISKSQRAAFAASYLPSVPSLPIEQALCPLPVALQPDLTNNILMLIKSIFFPPLLLVCISTSTQMIDNRGKHHYLVVHIW